MESLKMRKLINLITRLLKKDIIVCPCGYKTTNKKKAIKHLMSSHKEGVGSIDISTGAIVW